MTHVTTISNAIPGVAIRTNVLISWCAIMFAFKMMIVKLLVVAAKVIANSIYYAKVISSMETFVIQEKNAYQVAVIQSHTNAMNMLYQRGHGF